LTLREDWSPHHTLDHAENDVKGLKGRLSPDFPSHRPDSAKIQKWKKRK